MSKKAPSRDEALEAIDFIVNVLREHEKDLDRLIDELGGITEKMGDAGELNTKVEKIEEKLTTLQSEIGNLITYLSAPHENTAPPMIQLQPRNVGHVEAKESLGPPVILRCKQWDDFQSLADQAQTVSFLYREAEKTFQVDALKNNQIITYSGELPRFTHMLKTWLSRQLVVDEKRILEGVLAIG